MQTFRTVLKCFKKEKWISYKRTFFDETSSSLNRGMYDILCISRYNVAINNTAAARRVHLTILLYIILCACR